jgi:hypothetical protein
VNQDQWVNRMLEIGSIGAVIAVLQGIGVYTRLQPWWKKGNQIGRSLVLFAGFSMVTPVLFLLSLFLHLNRGDSHLLAWVEIALLLAYVPAMAWRSLVWIRVSSTGETGKLSAGEKDKS